MSHAEIPLLLLFCILYASFASLLMECPLSHRLYNILDSMCWKIRTRPACLAQNVHSSAGMSPLPVPVLVPAWLIFLLCPRTRGQHQWVPDWQTPPTYPPNTCSKCFKHSLGFSSLLRTSAFKKSPIPCSSWFCCTAVRSICQSPGIPKDASCSAPQLSAASWHGVNALTLQILPTSITGSG